MAKISLDVDEIKKNLRERAMVARTQLSEFALKAKTDSRKEVLKKLEQIVTIVKSKDLTHLPRVAKLRSRILTLSEQLEKAVTKNAGEIVEHLRETLGKTQKSDSKITDITIKAKTRGSKKKS